MNGNIRFWRSLIASVLVFNFTAVGRAANHTIEPDNYAEGTVLNNIHPLVQLRIFDGYTSQNFPVGFGFFPDPEVIPVTANVNPDIFGGYFTSTGTKTFGAADITFFPNSAQLAMRFLVPTSQVSIDFIGTNSLAAEIGVLEIYNVLGVLLDAYTSPPLLAHQKVTLSRTRPLGDIGYARAFSSPTADPFGTLDNLRFVTSTPGDLNGNGVVDAADYVTWRNGLATIYGAADYAAWRQNFGAGAGAGTTESFAVPEPTSVLFLLVVMLLHVARRSNLR